MGTWNVGPFDNDVAVEWCERLESLPRDQHAGYIRDALTTTTTHPDQMSDEESLEAVAAAAAVLQALTGIRDERSLYAPRFRVHAATPNLRSLALAAIRVVMAHPSWRARWAGHIEEDEASESLQALYKRLKAS